MSEIKWNTRMALEGNLDEDDDDRRKDQKAAPSGKAGDFNFIGKCLIRYCGPGKDVTFPEGFTTISDAVFQNCEGAANITSITIPKSITRIDPHAFSYCTNLSEIRVEAENQHYCVIDGLLFEQDGMVLHSCPPARSGVLAVPEGVTQIAQAAFAVCMRLTHVTIPKSVTRIDYDAFKFCRGLKSVTISEGVTRIGEFAFWNCSGLTEVTIPESVTDIGDLAFSGCTNLTRVVIPKSVVRIGIAAFYGCTNLAEIQTDAGNPFYSVIDGLLLERDGPALYLHTCSAAKSGVLEIPEGINRIEEGAFGGCKDLTGVIIPGSVCDIGRDAFVSCSGLAHVTIQEGVRFIGERAFSGCTNLTHLAFPKSICAIEYGAFYDTGMSEEAIQAAYDQADENRFLESEFRERFDLVDIGWIYTSDDEV